MPGSPVVRSLSRQLNRLLGQASQSSPARHRSLSDVGMIRRRDGMFSLDKYRFLRVLQTEPEGLPPILSGSDGPVAKISDLIRSMDNPSSGLQVRGATLERNIRKLSSDHVNLDIERQKITDRLLRKYVDMDQKVGQLKQVGSSIELMRDMLSAGGRGR